MSTPSTELCQRLMAAASWRVATTTARAKSASYVNATSALRAVTDLMRSCAFSAAHEMREGEEEGEGIEGEEGYQWPMLALFCIVLTTVSGNVLVCLAVYSEPKMRSMFNCFLVSLAVSDVLSACLVMPLSIIKAVAGNLPLPKMMCIAWYSLDVLFTSSTIIHLCMISVDRYMSLTYPLRYGHSRKTKHFVARIALVWIISACIAGPLFLLSMIDHPDSADGLVYKGCGPETPVFVISATMASFYVPLAIMAVMYVLTVRALHRQRRAHAPIALTQSVSLSRHSVGGKGNGRGKGGDAAIMSDEVDEPSGFVSPSPWSSPEVTRRSLRRAPSVPVTLPVRATGNIGPVDAVAAMDSSSDGGECCRARLLSTTSTKLVVPHERHMLRRNASLLSSSSRGKDSGYARSIAPYMMSTFQRSSITDDSTDAKLTEVAINGRTKLAKTWSGNNSSGSSFRRSNNMSVGGGSRQSVTNTGMNDGSFLATTDNDGSGSQTRRLLLRRSRSQGTGGSGSGSNRESASSRAFKGRRRAVQVIGILFAAFVMFYLPFFAAYLLRGTCAACRHYVTPAIITAFEWLAYSGSMANPIIYHMFNPDFRRAFQRLLHCNRCRY